MIDDQVAFWREQLEILTRKRDTLLARTPGRCDAADLAEIETERFELAASAPEGVEAAWRIGWEAAAAGAAAVICDQTTGGCALLTWPNGLRRRFPANGAELSVKIWECARACAVAVGALHEVAILDGWVAAGDERQPSDLRAWPNSLKPAPVTIAFDYDPRRTEYPEDPIAFLDLEGFPRSGIASVVVQRGNALIAKYRLTGRKCFPDATAEFVLNASNDEVPAALDPVERVLVAHHYSKLAGVLLESGKSKGARLYLQRAAEELDRVLGTIPAAAVVIPQESIASVRGRAAFADEPGRFRADRLTAYRDSLREQARELSPETGAAESARLSALTSVEVIRELVRPLLESFRSASADKLREQLQPRTEDYPQVFVGAAADRARQAYEEWWSRDLEFQPPSRDQSELLIFVAPAGMLASDNELSRHFPGGYRAIAEVLQPHRVWVAWKYRKAGESSGMAYDGLVWMENRWAWFPKPHRFVLDKA